MVRHLFGLHDRPAIGALNVPGIRERIVSVELLKLLCGKANWGLQYIERHVFTARRSRKRPSVSEVIAVFGEAALGQKVVSLDINSGRGILKAIGSGKILDQLIDQSRGLLVSA